MSASRSPTRCPALLEGKGEVRRAGGLADPPLTAHHEDDVLHPRERLIRPPMRVSASARGRRRPPARAPAELPRPAKLDALRALQTGDRFAKRVGQEIALGGPARPELDREAHLASGDLHVGDHPELCHGFPVPRVVHGGESFEDRVRGEGHGEEARTAGSEIRQPEGGDRG